MSGLEVPPVSEIGSSVLQTVIDKTEIAAELEEPDAFRVFDGIMDIPAWLSDDNSSVDSGTENYILEQNLDDYHSALPWFDYVYYTCPSLDLVRL